MSHPRCRKGDDARVALRILIVEDDADLRSNLRRSFEEEGFEVRTAADGTQALRQALVAPEPDLYVLDVGLPDADGRDVCQALRARGQLAPVVFLTARDAVTDRLAGFGAGGDDYLTKPFAFAELLARVHALLRRAGAGGATALGDVQLDPAAHALVVGDLRVALTPTEFRLLAALAARPGAALRRQELINTAWPDGAIVHDNARRSSPGCAQAADLPGREIATVRRRVPAVARRTCAAVSLWLRWLVPLTIAVLTVAFNLVLAANLRSDLGRRLRTAPPPLATVQVSGRGDHKSPRATRRWTAAFGSGGTRIVGGPPPRRRCASAGAGGRSDSVDAAGGDTRLYAQPILERGARVGTVVAAASLAAYDRTTRAALVGSVLFALAMLLAVAVVSWLITGAALRPVREMTDHAAEWSEHDTGRRFGAGDRPDELGRLAATFDALLDRIAAACARAAAVSDCPTTADPL